MAKKVMKKKAAGGRKFAVKASNALHRLRLSMPFIPDEWRELEAYEDDMFDFGVELDKAITISSSKMQVMKELLEAVVKTGRVTDTLKQQIAVVLRDV